MKHFLSLTLLLLLFVRLIHAQGNGNLTTLSMKFVDENGKAHYGLLVSIFDNSNKKLGEWKTDAQGILKVTVYKNSSYTARIQLDGAETSLPFNTGDKDSEAFEVALSAAPLTDDGMVKFILHVEDDKGVPETNTAIKVKLNGSVVFECTTDIDGECTALLEQKQGYSLQLEKFGKTFTLDMNMPADRSLSEYRYDITIKVIEGYKRVYTLENVYFDHDKWDIKPGSYTALNELYTLMISNPSMKIEVAGHTDNDGNDIYNMRLSQKRADAVKQYLEKKGVTSSRILSKGYGETSPMDDNSTEQVKARNRRTEVRVISE